MLGQLIRRLKPEDEELLRKREEMAALRATLVERELELIDLRSQLAIFEGRYLRQVGALYAELDEWRAKIAELQARLDPSSGAAAQAEEARKQARQTYEDAHGEASRAPNLTPSPELKKIYREAAKRMHPDLSAGPDDLERRTRFMAEANRAYQAGDAASLQRILDEYEDGAEAVRGEGIGAELIRIIRQISQAKERIAAIEQELATLRQSEIALLKKQSEESAQAGRDLLTELAAEVQKQVAQTKREYETLAKQDKRT